MVELRTHGYKADHWLEVGVKAAPDHAILEHARKHKYIVLTCDLDFGDILAASGSKAPSVFQLRPGKMRPEVLIPSVVAAIRKHGRLLHTGALLTIDLKKSRARALPLRV